MTKFNRSEIFSVYNKAKAAARAGLLDARRVDRALGILIADRVRPYRTTKNSCTCPDARRNRCKHQIAEMMRRRMLAAQAGEYNYK
jgi:hypothetical protein